MSIDNDSPITALDLRTAAPKALADAGITTLGQLLALNRDHLPGIKGMGKARVEDVLNTCAQLGLAFADGMPPIICETCGNRRARDRRNIVRDLAGRLSHVGFRKTPTCHECHEYHQQVWNTVEAVAA